MRFLSRVIERFADLKFQHSTLVLRHLRKRMLDVYPMLRLQLDRGRRTALIAELEHCDTVEGCIDFTRKHLGTGACQIAGEIQAAIECLAESQPRVLCEIGTLDGGTSLLFTRFLHSLEAMVCIDLYVKNKKYLSLLSRPTCRLHFVDRPSYAGDTVAKVRKILGGRPIDVLFIDGDHRYEGVRKDFIAYHPLVRDGGSILLHDIVEAHGGGRAWVGGVPRLWKELAAVYPHREFIHDRAQEGFGIGLVTHHPSAGLARLLGTWQALETQP